jgi:hypothetical protein
MGKKTEGTRSINEVLLRRQVRELTEVLDKKEEELQKYLGAAIKKDSEIRLLTKENAALREGIRKRDIEALEGVKP